AEYYILFSRSFLLPFAVYQYSKDLILKVFRKWHPPHYEAQNGCGHRVNNSGSIYLQSPDAYFSHISIFLYAYQIVQTQQKNQRLGSRNQLHQRYLLYRMPLKDYYWCPL